MFNVSVCLCSSMWRTTWQSCPSASCSAVQMMLSSGGDLRKMVFILLSYEFSFLFNLLGCDITLQHLCCLSIRDDQAVFEGCRLGRPGLPHCGHSPRHLRRTPIDRSVPKLHPRRWSCHHHNAAGCRHTPTHRLIPPYRFSQTQIAFTTTRRGNSISGLF